MDLMETRLMCKVSGDPLAERLRIKTVASNSGITGSVYKHQSHCLARLPLFRHRLFFSPPRFCAQLQQWDPLAVPPSPLYIRLCNFFSIFPSFAIFRLQFFPSSSSPPSFQ